MSKKVLVTYASKHGSTAEVAEKIGAVISNAGVDVDLFPVTEVSSLEPYHTVVIGNAVYIGNWRKEGIHFLKDQATELAKKKTWLFSTGPTGEGDPVELLKGWKFPDSMKSTIEQIGPIDIAVFHGALDVSKLNKLERMAIKMVKAPLGDFRDWEAVNRWAEGIVKGIR